MALNTITISTQSGRVTSTAEDWFVSNNLLTWSE